MNHLNTTLGPTPPPKPLFPPYQRPYSPTFQFLIFCIILALLVGLIVGLVIFWCPHPPQFQITSASVSSFDVSNSQITALWNIYFYVKNPNIRKLSYEHMEGSVYYKGIRLAAENLSSIMYQPRKSRGLYFMGIHALDVNIGNDVVSGVVSDWERGVVAFEFKVRGKVWFGSVTLISVDRWMRVECENVIIGFFPNMTNGFMMGGLKQCNVHL